MLRKPMFWDLFGMICFIAALHILAAKFDIYWLVPLFDVPMHFLGGFWIGLTSLWIYYIGEYVIPFKKTNRAMLFASLISVLCVGLGWEVFEFLGDITGPTTIEKIDVLQDICIDLLGGIAAYLYFKYRNRELTLH
jgi:hypothetical protein